LTDLLRLREGIPWMICFVLWRWMFFRLMMMRERREATL
jgi:hypothetical protein